MLFSSEKKLLQELLNNWFLTVERGKKNGQKNAAKCLFTTFRVVWGKFSPTISPPHVSIESQIYPFSAFLREAKKKENVLCRNFFSNSWYKYEWNLSCYKNTIYVQLQSTNSHHLNGETSSMRQQLGNTRTWLHPLRRTPPRKETLSILSRRWTNSNILATCH